MNYRLVLWDFDGTIADTLKSAVEIYNRLAPKYYALPMTDPESLRGLTAAELVRRHNIRCHRFPFLIREFLAEQARTMTEVGLHEGIAETLESLTGSGVRHAIASSNSESNIRSFLKHHAVGHHFEFVVGIRRLFGKRRGLKNALRLSKLAPGEVLYVGDETRDIRAAHQIKMPIASVTWGANSSSLLAEHGPEYLITAPEELLTIVRPLDKSPDVDR
jgi:phosphoglycolate phosphatase